MLGSLDVTKIYWRSCPTAWKGEFEGKEGIPSIGLEDVADYNLRIWHSDRVKRIMLNLNVRVQMILTKMSRSSMRIKLMITLLGE